MKKSIFAAILLVAFSSILFAQTHKTSLVVASYKPSEKFDLTHDIYRYDFVNGEYVGKELIASSKEIYFRTRFNRIYQNRYAISSSGDIVDVLKKKILHENKGNLHRIEGNKVYIEVNRDNDRGLYAYDLAKKKYSLVRRNKDNLGELSPNGLRRLWTNINNITVFENGKEIEFDTTFDLKVEKDDRSANFVAVGALWLDDERFLTQRGNGNLVIVDIKKNITPVLQIPNETECKGNPHFRKNENGKYIYHCTQNYEIDLKKKTYQIARNGMGFGFEIKKIDNLQVTYTFNDKEIGSVWTYDMSTAKDFLAVIYGKENRNTYIPKGIKVWNAIKKDWTEIKTDWVENTIGWINY